MNKIKIAFRVLLGIAVLVTAAIHLYLGVVYNALMFFLNGLGFLGLSGAFLLPIPGLRPFRRWIGLVLMGYSALTILLWVVLNGQLDLTSASAKLAELLIIITVGFDLQKENQG